MTVEKTIKWIRLVRWVSGFITNVALLALVVSLLRVAWWNVEPALVKPLVLVSSLVFIPAVVVFFGTYLIMRRQAVATVTDDLESYRGAVEATRVYLQAQGLDFGDTVIVFDDYCGTLYKSPMWMGHVDVVLSAVEYSRFVGATTRTRETIVPVPLSRIQKAG
jgi:hypothetical protein